MMNFKIIGLTFILIIFNVGCGTTDIMVNNSNVDIYINGAHKGKGSVAIKRTGPPKKAHIKAKYKGYLVGETTIKRKMTSSTAIIGLFSYGLGLVFCWQYPDFLVVAIKNEMMEQMDSVQGGKNIWMAPPGKWDK